MIIDLLNNYPIEDHSCIIETAQRWYLNEYRQSTKFDMHKEYSDAPYWGDGECEHGVCKSCTHVCNISNETNEPIYVNHYDSDECCEEYEDKEYNKWFENIITDAEKEWIEEINGAFKRQVKLFEEDEEWIRLVRDEITIQLLVWLEERNITYCIVKVLADFEDQLFLKISALPDEYYALFTHTPKKYHLDYCVENHGWVWYKLGDLINKKESTDIDKIFEWMSENTVGCFQYLSHSYDGVYFECEEDVMAVKLRWM